MHGVQRSVPFWRLSLSWPTFAAAGTVLWQQLIAAFQCDTVVGTFLYDKGTTLNQAPEVSALVFLTAGVLLGIAQRFFFLKILVPEVTLFYQCISIHFKKP